MTAFVRLFVPSQAVGASTVHFDLFNATGSTAKLHVHSINPIVVGSTAVTGVLGIDLYLTRTTAIGTGGTAATLEGTSLSAATFSNVNSSIMLSPSITARLTPSGGATAGAVLGYTSVFGEETSAAAYTAPRNMVRCSLDEPALTVPEGSGIRVVQGSVAATGNVLFVVVFSMSRSA